MAKGDVKGRSNQLVEPAQKKKFIEMRDHWRGLDDRAKSAAGKRREYLKDCKNAGFSLEMFKVSLQLETPEGEAEFKAGIANQLLAAAYADADIGDQLHLFLEPNRTPAVDRAHREGETAAMENKAAKPKYAPDTEQYRAYMEGYHGEQERQVLKGIKKKDDAAAKSAKGAKKAAPEPAKKRGRPAKAKETAAPAPRKAKGDDAPPRRPSAKPVTRATLAAAEAAPEETESYFSKTVGNA